MKKIISTLMIFTLIFGVLVYPGGLDVFAVEDYNEEYLKLQEKLEKAEDNMQNAQSQISSKEAYVETLNQQISVVQEQIDVLDEKIGALQVKIDGLNVNIDKLATEIAEHDAKIEKLQGEITAAKDELDTTFEQLKVRLRASYISGSSSMLELLLTSDDVSKFLIRAEYIKRSSDKDQEIMDSLEDQIDELKTLETEEKEQRKVVADKKSVFDAEKAELVENQNEIKSSANILENKKSDLSNKKSEAASMINQLNKDTQTYKNLIAEIESDMEEMEEKFREQTSSGSASGSVTLSPGGWAWPVPMAGTYVSSPYGYRIHPIYGTYRMHTGIDISGGGINGQRIVASKAGTVTYANWGYGGGYGNYVIVDHGGGYSTLYAHCSSLAVSSGQYVKQGQTIAYVGSTGASTGPHLHFEVRINGNHTNPLNYVSK